ncbi:MULTISPECIES: Rieske 2Fe-2S domain-containing protein [Streptomyces]|uniref:Rieske 2Fe-2S domain-containing protein n=1 Tax=Streptomyces apricus TaxID=1828112 RepID=A0A5B0BJR1_9ACTN|nr:Rieske 2Fe-2S domain-containing protein [Streptomyces apricus]KAA0941502.1 Rieske 2Fe-2S domain-containing protein [Streptomyces apricus]
MSDAPVRWFDVPEAAGLWEGDLVDAEVAGERVLVVHRLDGSFAAYQGMCPHQEFPLADGVWDEEEATLTCSGHGWRFDLDSGTGVNPAGCRLYRYPVRAIDDGTVRIGIPQDGGTHHNRCRGL